MIKRVLCSVAAAALVPAVLWVGGVDFDRRGAAQALTLYWALAVGACCYFYPGWRND